ncbi:MAG: ATP-binding cassette domain-containing protein, partial [Treponema sp.]|nr:ATP-binding cassette domain-containing protein [Treponema sp.]
MGEPLIELREVSFTAQDNRIVENVSLTFMEGTATALTGPSGGGKSTVLKLAAGILVPDRGDVRYRGQNIATFNRTQNLNFRRETAVVFQDSALWANQTLYQTLELPLSIHYPRMSGNEREARIREVVSEVGYRRDLMIRPALLSMGEQKLIGFARAMLCRPALLFLDEWTESLDDKAVRRLVALVRRFKSGGNTLVFISHDFDLVSNLSDCVIMIT